MRHSIVRWRPLAGLIGAAPLSAQSVEEGKMAERVGMRTEVALGAEAGSLSRGLYQLQFGYRWQQR